MCPKKWYPHPTTTKTSTATTKPAEEAGSCHSSLLNHRTSGLKTTSLSQGMCSLMGQGGETVQGGEWQLRTERGQTEGHSIRRVPFLFAQWGGLEELAQMGLCLRYQCDKGPGAGRGAGAWSKGSSVGKLHVPLEKGAWRGKIRGPRLWACESLG